MEGLISAVFAAMVAASCYAFNVQVESQRSAPATIERRVDLSNLSTIKRTAQPVSSSRSATAANVTWQKAKLPQHRGVYTVYDFMYPQNCLEGGVAQYHNLRLIGHKDAVERITQALNEIWADSEARAVAASKPRDVHCIQLDGFYGCAKKSGTIAVDPFKQDAIHTAGTIYHELLHNARGDHPEEIEHRWIVPLQQEFVARRQRG